MNILVYSGLELLGDGVMKLPFVGALRHRWPEAQITWLAGKGRTVYAGVLAPLVQGLIDEIIEDAGIGSRAAELLARPLPGRRFDLVIDTQRRVLTTLILYRLRTACFVSGAADFRLSSRSPGRGYRRPARLIDQLLDLVDIAGGRRAEPQYAIRVGSPWADAADRVLPPGPCYVGIAPGAGGEHKRWPRERFAALAEAQRQSGRQPVFVLGPDEAGWRPELQARVPPALFPLQDERIPTEIASSPLFTLAVAQRLAVSVANDSGTGHLLGASGRPLVSLFGPTPAAKFAPAASRLEIVDAGDFGGSDMALIPVHAVATALERRLAEAVPAFGDHRGALS